MSKKWIFVAARTIPTPRSLARGLPVDPSPHQPQGILPRTDLAQQRLIAPLAAALVIGGDRLGLKIAG